MLAPDEAIHFDQVRETIRISINAIKSPGPPEETDPRFRKLVEGILYSRRLILTYHFVILGFVLIVAAFHWSHLVIRWRKRRLLCLKQEEIYDQDATIRRPDGKSAVASYTDETSSSGSSTIGRDISSPAKTRPTEDTPLLHDGHRLQPKRTLISSLKALQMYQPPPIPFFNKTLPSNGSTLLLLAFIALNVFYTLFHINYNILELFVFADRCGAIFVANLPLLYILAAKTQPLTVLTGCSYESLNIFHRRLGELMCLEAVFHSFGMVGVWYTLLRPSGTMNFIQFLTNKVILLGLFAFIAYETLYLTSLASFRQRWYELFLGLHVFLQAAALVLVFFHHPVMISRVYIGIALAVFVVDRLVYRLGMKSTSVEARTKILEDGDTVKVSAKISLRPSSSSLFGKSMKTGWSATDHVFLTVPSLARKHLFQAHPFTISSPAPTTHEEEASLDLIIRAQDGFSADLLRRSKTHKTLNVRLDGPYGSSHARHLAEDADLAILVAGGSGVAVAWPILNHLLHISQARDLESEFPKRQEIVFIWIIREESHISWIGKDALAAMEAKGVKVIVPGATELAGRPDLKTMLEDIVANTGPGRKVGVVASGPDEMGRTVRNTCAGLVCEGRDIDVTIEKFGW